MGDLFQLREPETLEDIARDNFIKWMIFPHATNIARVEKNTIDVLRRAIDISPNQVEALKKYVNHLPGLIQQNLLTELMTQLLNLFENHCPVNSTMKYKRTRGMSIAEEYNIIGAILEVFFTEKIQVLKLNCDDIKTFGGIFADKGYMLNGLTDLRLGIPLIDLDRDIHGEVYKDVHYRMESKILAILKNCQGFKRLSINFCTDKIFRCIIENCKFIENLELYCDLNFKSDIFELLSESPNLISIDLHVVFVSIAEERGIEKQRKQSLEVIATKKQFNIRSFMSYIVESSKNHLQMLIEKYPLMGRLSLSSIDVTPMLDRRGLPKESLAGFKNLEDLELSFFKFYKSGVLEVLDNVGGNLKKLVLECVSEVDLNVMKVISLKFPILEELSLNNCNYKKADTMSNLIRSNIEMPAFPRLQSFSLHTIGFSKTNLPCITFVLSNCPNIEKIDMYAPNVTERILLHIFGENSLSCLTQLNVYSDKDHKITL